VICSHSEGGWGLWILGSLGLQITRSEAGSYLRLIDSCITQLKAHGPSRTCNESKEEEEAHTDLNLHGRRAGNAAPVGRKHHHERGQQADENEPAGERDVVVVVAGVDPPVRCRVQGVGCRV